MTLLRTTGPTDGGAAGCETPTRSIGPWRKCALRLRQLRTRAITILAIVLFAPGIGEANDDAKTRLGETLDKLGLKFLGNVAEGFIGVVSTKKPDNHATTDPKNIHCRFNKSFLRESVYQVMLFKDQKQYLHSQLAEYLQSLPTSVLDPH